MAMPIRRRNENNPDWMARMQDEELKSLEKRISALYEEARHDVTEEYNRFFTDYQLEYENRLAKVESGEITEADFQRWCRNNILQSNQYQSTIRMLTDVLVNADVAAMSAVNEQLPYTLAESYDFISSLGFEAADKAGISMGTFQIYNADSVQAIIRDNPDLLPVVDLPEDEMWNRNHINNEITQAIIQGDSMQQVAQRLQRVASMDNNAAIRNARTSMTAAENLGRSESARRLRQRGLPVEEVWSATLDDRTRDSHLLLDGTKKDENGYYGVGILNVPLRFPADPRGEGKEIYNCRCRENVQIAGIDHSRDDELYEQFMQENHPEDWAELQSRRADPTTGEGRRWQERQDALERQARLRRERQAIDIPPMTEQNMFDGLNPSETDKHGKTDIDSISADGNKVAVVLDRQMLITRYDSLGQPQYYVGVGNNEGIAIERWQVSAESHTAEGKQYHAHVVILDRNNFEQRVSVPPLITQFSKWETYTDEYDDGGIPVLNFEDYLKLARHQSNADGYLYGMGKVWGYDDDDNPHHFRPTFRYSQYSSWGEERERERRREQARRRRRR